MKEAKGSESDHEKGETLEEFEEADEQQGVRFLRLQLEHIMAYEALGIC